MDDGIDSLDAELSDVEQTPYGGTSGTSEAAPHPSPAGTPKTPEGKVPTPLVVGGGLCFVLTFLAHPVFSIIGILLGVYIIYRYPAKKIHGIIPILLNLAALSVIVYAYLTMEAIRSSVEAEAAGMANMD